MTSLESAATRHEYEGTLEGLEQLCIGCLPNNCLLPRLCIFYNLGTLECDAEYFREDWLI